MRRFLSRSRTLAALLLLLAWAPVARADNPQRAKELFQEGTTFFDLGQFDKAIESWQAGYRERPDPGFLYNIAQAYRLAGDANKAIFFYKGYLRNAPKAHNRADVEQKIEALQQKVTADQKEGAKPAVTPTPTPAAQPGTAGAPPPGPQPAVARGDASGAPAAPAPLQPPPAAPPPAAGTATQPLAMAGPTEPPPVAPPSVIASEPPTVRAQLPPPVAAPDERPPRLDLGFALGFDTWGTSVQGKADPSLALSLSAGYIALRTTSPRHPIVLRVGGTFGYTFLKEATGRDTFLSALVVPALFIGLSPRVALYGEFGVGALGIWGLKPGSPLLLKEDKQMVNGSQGMLEIRPALGLQFQINRAMGVYGAAAVDYSPKKPHFYAPISRTELLLGFSFRTLAI